MAGYSGKPLTQKLGLQPGFCIFVDGAVDDTWSALKLVIPLKQRIK